MTKSTNKNNAPTISAQLTQDQFRRIQKIEALGMKFDRSTLIRVAVENKLMEIESICRIAETGDAMR